MAEAARREVAQHPAQWVKAQGLAMPLWLKRAVVVVLLLAVAGAALGPLEKRAWMQVRALQPELRLGELEGALGQGVVLGLLGGFRAIVADFVWLEAHSAWEEHDPARVEGLLDMTTSVDPRPLFFWQNKVRMLALDMPMWELRRRGGFQGMPEAARREMFTFYAHRGLAAADEGLQFHPDEPELIEYKAMIYNTRLSDKAKAAEFYRKAAAIPGSRVYFARAAAALLDEVGRTQEAYDYLNAYYAAMTGLNAVQDAGYQRQLRELKAKLSPEDLQD